MARAAIWIDVDAADDIVTFEDRVCEAPALLEVLGMSDQILQVRFQVMATGQPGSSCSLNPGVSACVLWSRAAR